MESKQIVLCDTNILIEFYKNNTSIINDLKTIGIENIAINTIVLAELIYGAHNKKELKEILKNASQLSIFSVNDAISQLTIQLMVKFSLSHTLALPDVFIAATALYHKCPLFTLNKKDFKFIDDLVLYSN